MFLIRAYNRARVKIWHRWSQWTSGQRSYPDFLIVGPRRTGTTSLYQALRKHPNIYGASRKEVKFFDCNYEKGMDWYQAFFPRKSKVQWKNALVMEASPYYFLHPLAAQRIKENFPQIKVIALLRNPIDRAYSNYHMNYDLEVEPLPTFEEAIEAEPARLAGEEAAIIADPSHPVFNHMHLSYLTQGIYADALARWFEVFPREQILVLHSERFYAHMPETMLQVQRFLGLPEKVISVTKNANPGKYPPMKAETRAKLAAYFAPHNQRLYQLLGEDFGWEKEK